MEYLDEIYETIDLCEKALLETKKRGKAHANSHREYRVALAKKILELKNEGFPATLCLDLARGDEKVADLKEQEEIDESLYFSSKEAINVYKIKIKIIHEVMVKDEQQTR